MEMLVGIILRSGNAPLIFFRINNFTDKKKIIIVNKRDERVWYIWRSLCISASWSLILSLALVSPSANSIIGVQNRERNGVFYWFFDITTVIMAPKTFSYVLFFSFFPENGSLQTSLPLRQSTPVFSDHSKNRRCTIDQITIFYFLNFEIHQRCLRYRTSPNLVITTWLIFFITSMDVREPSIWN